MAALVACGVLMLPWQISAVVVSVLTVTVDFGHAMVSTAIFGWISYILREVRNA